MKYFLMLLNLRLVAILLLNCFISIILSFFLHLKLDSSPNKMVTVVILYDCLVYGIISLLFLMYNSYFIRKNKLIFFLIILIFNGGYTLLEFNSLNSGIGLISFFIFNIFDGLVYLFFIKKFDTD